MQSKTGEDDPVDEQRADDAGQDVQRVEEPRARLQGDDETLEEDPGAPSPGAVMGELQLPQRAAATVPTKKYSP